MLSKGYRMDTYYSYNYKTSQSSINIGVELPTALLHSIPMFSLQAGPTVNILLGSTETLILVTGLQVRTTFLLPFSLTLTTKVFSTVGVRKL